MGDLEEHLKKFVTDGEFDSLEATTEDSLLYVASGSLYVLVRVAQELRDISDGFSPKDVVSATRYDANSDEPAVTEDGETRDLVAANLDSADFGTMDARVKKIDRHVFYGLSLRANKIKEGITADGVACATRIVAVLRGYGCRATITGAGGDEAGAGAYEEATVYDGDVAAEDAGAFSKSEGGDSFTSFLDESNVGNEQVLDRLSMRSVAV